MAEISTASKTTTRKITTDDLTAAREAGASAADLNLIATLKQRAAEFEAARLELIARGPAVARTNDYDLMVEYGELVNRSETIRDKISAATQAIDGAINWARGTFGLSGMQALSSLGVVWFLPAAVITAAVAVIGYWISDYIKFAKRFTEQTRIAADLKAQGMDPAEAQRQAARVVASTSPTFAGAISKPLLLVALLLVGGYVYQRSRS